MQARIDAGCVFAKCSAKADKGVYRTARAPMSAAAREPLRVAVDAQSRRAFSALITGVGVIR